MFIQHVYTVQPGVSTIGRTWSDAVEPIETVLVTSGGAKKLHIPEEGAEGSLCGIGDRARKKSLAVFPPSYRDWCSYCRELWKVRATGRESVEHHLHSTQ